MLHYLSSQQRQHTHTHPFNGPFSGTTQARKVKPIWILLKQETVSGSGISWDICKSAPHSRQITTPALHHSVFYRPDALPAAQPTASKHWRHTHPFNSPLSGTTWVSWYQKGKINLDFTEATDSEWQWHQMGLMQVCTSLQTDTTPAPHHSVFTAWCYASTVLATALCPSVCHSVLLKRLNIGWHKQH